MISTAQIEEQYAAYDSGSSDVPPHIAAKLRWYQRPAAAAIVRGLRRWDGFIDASDCGLGKSFDAIAAALALELQPIVICPKAVIPAWKGVAKHFGCKNLIVMNYEKLRTGKTSLGTWVTEEAKGKKRKYFKWTLPENCLLVWDEVHRVSALNSQNAQMHLFAQCTGVKMLNLSATAAESPLQMRAIGASLGLFKIQDYYAWANAHGVRRGKFGFDWNFGLHYKDPSIGRRQKDVMRKIHQQIFGEGRGVRLRKRDIPGFPKFPIICDPINFDDATNDIQKAYQEMIEELAELQRKIDENKAIRAAKTGKPLHEIKESKVTIQLRALQKIELLKVPALVEMAEDAIAEGQSVVIFCWFTQTLHAYADRLNTKCLIWGGQSATERKKSIEDFQADRSRAIIANLQAGGVGIGLHDLNGNYPRKLFVPVCFDSRQMRQAMERTERDGTLTEGEIVITWAANTVEDRAREIVQRKINCMDALNDADLEASITLSGDYRAPEFHLQAA